MRELNIAIHQRVGSFTDRWIDYCVEKGIKHSIVDCFQTDIITTLIEGNFTHLMWHLNHSSSKELKLYSYILNAADALDIKTYPNFQSRWHFDDKVAQKYLLEAIGAPLIDSYVFYDKSKARTFIKTAKLPIVAKLKRGAGASNVQLITTENQAFEYIDKMFDKGINPLPTTLSNLDQKVRIIKRLKEPRVIFRKIWSYIGNNKIQRNNSDIEKGYVYFQKFLHHNEFDTRVIVTKDKAFAIRRFNRNNDFRASGSGKIDYNHELIDKQMIVIAFQVIEQLKAQCLAFDFVYENGIPKIIEISFGFSMLAYDNCPGYWDRNLMFVKQAFNPQYFMIEEFLEE